MIEDHVEAPEEELKRAEHLIFVSLKITRTCGIMKNAIRRLIAAYELAFLELLQILKDKGKIDEIPESNKERAQMAKEFIDAPQFSKYMTHYNLLKKIEMAECEYLSEFRKDVTLKTIVGKPIEVKIDTLYQYLEITKEGVKFIKTWISQNIR